MIRLKIGLLSDVSVGEICSIYAVELHERFANRLAELGIYDGVEVRCISVAPAGSPIALWICGTMIALRKADCSHIMVLRTA